MFRRNAREIRVLILAPIGRDAELLASTLDAAGIEPIICSSDTLLPMLKEGAGCVIVAEEALNTQALAALQSWLEEQPPWSDFPFVVLTSSGHPTRQSRAKAHELEVLGNFTLIERPVRPDTIHSAVRSALRGRMRQYEMRSRQEALLQANADLEQFAHSASHDLREPLRSIGIYSELLSRDFAGVLDEKGHEFLAQIRSSTLRMDDLLKDLLSYAHASNISNEQVAPVSAQRSLDIALENLAGAIQESGAEIITEEVLPPVRIRESHLSQIFQNLIGNAIKYRKEGSRPAVRLSAQRENGRWLISVADNGIGIPAVYKETIFGIFKRLHNNSRYSGTGMGLAICQRIVERYQGRIWVESEPGDGATFFFTVPA